MGGELSGKMRGLLLRRIRVVMIVVAAVAALLVVGSTLIDEGEIVKLETRDADGRDYVTEVWIVDLPQGPYLRSGTRDSRWLERIRTDPIVVITRDDQAGSFRAIPHTEDAIRKQVNAAMRAKYGFADRIWDRVSDQRSAVPIRLEPVATAAARASH